MEEDDGHSFSALGGLCPEALIYDDRGSASSRWIINRRFLKGRFFPHFCSHKKRLNPKFHRVFEAKWKAGIITLLEGKTSDYKDAIVLPPVLWDAPEFITRRRWDTDWFRQALVERKIMARMLRRNGITTGISINRQPKRHIINGSTIHATTERNENFSVKLKECRCRATHSNTLLRMRILTLLNHLRCHYILLHVDMSEFSAFLIAPLSLFVRFLKKGYYSCLIQ